MKTSRCYNVALVGPTGVGKTDLSQELALEFNAEIVNCDSLLFYRGMDIGTAKPKKFLVPHHLIDCANPDEHFDIEKFRNLALSTIAAIHNKKKNIFIVGGSGFYLRALTQGLYEVPQVSYELRTQLEKEETGALYERLKKLDPQGSSPIHPHDRYRTIRALEMILLSGKKVSQIKKDFEKSHASTQLNITYVGLDLPRTELHEKIKARTKNMLEEGLEGEVKTLLEKYPATTRSLQSVGYKHMISYLKNKISLTQCEEEIVQSTRQLAKRQLTWFRNQVSATWFHPVIDRSKIYDFIREISGA